MAMVRRLVISRGGQVSVPAEVRKRWGTRAVIAEDQGDRLVLRPASDDPVAAVRGVLAEKMRGGPSSEELRAGARAEEVDVEDAQRRH
jgi:bifunctional DNA-binding transcriptional regulator/antitoxin component of YhaV-PrlF toxin-antitoxin module